MRVRRTTGWVVATALLSVACGPSGGDRAPGPVVSDPKLDVASALDGPDHPSFPDPLIELDDLVSGGPPPDGIPPIDRPRFAPANRVDRLDGESPCCR